MILKLFMDGMFAYLNYFLLLTLFVSFNYNLCFSVFCARFRSTTKEAFMVDVI
jgi:hypothetical protein